MQPIIWHDEKRKISELIPAEYNPRKLTEFQAAHLRTSLQKFGVAEPLVINLSNVIIGGHQRYKLLSFDKVEEVDVRVPNRLLTDAEEKELNIRLNRNTGEFDFEVLANQYEVEQLVEYGFQPYEFGMTADIAKDFSKSNKEISESEIRSGLNCKCPKCGFEFENTPQ